MREALTSDEESSGIWEVKPEFPLTLIPVMETSMTVQSHARHSSNTTGKWRAILLKCSSKNHKKGSKYKGSGKTNGCRHTVKKCSSLIWVKQKIYLRQWDDAAKKSDNWRMAGQNRQWTVQWLQRWPSLPEPSSISSRRKRRLIAPDTASRRQRHQLAGVNWIKVSTTFS